MDSKQLSKDLDCVDEGFLVHFEAMNTESREAEEGKYFYYSKLHSAVFIYHQSLKIPLPMQVKENQSHLFFRKT